MLPNEKQYELIVLGATGHTGKLCAEHIATSLPTSLKWAVAGRSRSKLSSLAAELQTLNADRVQPSKSFTFGLDQFLLTLSQASKWLLWILKT